MKYAFGIAILVAIWAFVSPDRGSDGTSVERPVVDLSHADEQIASDRRGPSDKEVELQNELDAVDQEISRASAQAGMVADGRTTAQRVARLKELDALLEALSARRNSLIGELQLEKQ